MTNDNNEITLEQVHKLTTTHQLNPYGDLVRSIHIIAEEVIALKETVAKQATEIETLKRYIKTQALVQPDSKKVRISTGVNKE